MTELEKKAQEYASKKVEKKLNTYSEEQTAFFVETDIKQTFEDAYAAGFRAGAEFESARVEENSRLRELLQLYAGCNVCKHFLKDLKCDIGGKCDGKEWSV